MKKIQAVKSMALLVPVLTLADVAAGVTYLKHLDMYVAARLFPWTMVGMLAGLSLMGKV